MQRIAMLGSGFIGRFYAHSLQGYRSKDKIVSIYSHLFCDIFIYKTSFVSI